MRKSDPLLSNRSCFPQIEKLKLRIHEIVEVCKISLSFYVTHPHTPWLVKRERSTTRGKILGIRCGEILLISSYTLPAIGRVSAKNVNKLTDPNAAVSSPAHSAFHSIPDLCEK